MSESTLQQQILEHIACRQPLHIQGNQSKSFYGNRVTATPLDTRQHSGIGSYEPDELVITVKCGTALRELQQILHEKQQILAFEPPCFADNASVGGTIACGLAGPRRPFGGAVRDSVLGIKMINGHGKILNFGGQVMKNVAGYDISRLMTGSLGTLGLILEVSLKVLPAPQYEETRCLDIPEHSIIETMSSVNSDHAMLSACAYYQGMLYCRLSGTEQGVKHTGQQIGGEPLSKAPLFWYNLNEHIHPFFSGTPLWRIIVPNDTPLLPIDGSYLLDWGGALRWHHTNTPAAVLRDTVARYGGHATLFKGTPDHGHSEYFHPLSATALALHERIKAAFDPLNLFNPGRMYSAI